MMNPMQPQQPMGGMGAAPELTEEELRKLALLLQQMPEGEGLATVSPMEEQQMKDDGGAGTPLPGTQGLGPAGGPVKSYAKKEDGRIDEDHRIAVLTDAEVGAMQFIKEQEKGQGFSSGNGPLITALSALSTTEPDYINYKGMRIPTLNDSSDGFGGTENSNFTDPPDPSPTGTGGPPGTSSGGGWDPSAGRDDQGYLPDHPNYQGGGGTTPTPTPGGGGGGGRTYVPPPPPKYKDMNGKEWDTQAEADASNEAIKAAMSGIEGQALTSDSTFARWTARNKDNEAYAGLTPEQMETAYNTALTKSQEDASAQVPQMVESMNNFFAETDKDGNKIYGENTTFEEFKTKMGAAMPANLSEATLRDMYANAVTKFQRGEAFTLTPEEVAEFKRTAIKTATVSDAAGVTIGTVGDATLTDVGDVADVTPEDVEAIASVTDEDIDAIFTGGTDKAEALLLARINGTADSPAEQQLFRTSEQNLRMLLGATAGGNADPSKVRQLKNVWADMTQVAVGDAADLRSRESLAAESQLVELYRGKDTMKLNTKLANMEKDKQVAFKNGDMALAGNLSNQQTALQRVITKASLDTNVKLANLEKAKTLAIDQGKLDLATNIANLQKNLTIATVDAKLAVSQRAMDDAVAMAAYEGQQELYGLESSIDIETMKSDLTKMGFDLSRDLAEMDNATRIEVARLTGEYNSAISSSNRDSAKEAAIIGAIGTVITAWAASDINMKTNISPGSGEVESFLDALNSYKYEYKDENAPGADAGMFLGVMAQDLEKTPMGASFVKDTPNGKMVDYGHGLAAILASQASLHDRIRHLEEG
jgi:hypothetical protein